MPNNSPEEYDLFPRDRQKKNEIFPNSPSTKDDLFPYKGSPEGDLYPEFRTTEEDLKGIEKFAEAQNLAPIDKKRLIEYYRDVDLDQKKPKNKNDGSLF